MLSRSLNLKATSMAWALLALLANRPLHAQEMADSKPLAVVPLRGETTIAPPPAAADSSSAGPGSPAAANQGTTGTSPATTGPGDTGADLTGPPTAGLADALMARGRYLAALRVYGQLQPTTARIQNRMGVASERMLMFSQAEGNFRAALKLDPALAEAYNNLGTVLHNRGDLRGAEKMYRKAIKLDGNTADAYQNLGALYYSKRNFKKGDVMYREAIRIDPGVMERTARRGIQAGGASKNGAEMHYHLACNAAQGGNPRLAMDYLRRAVIEGFHDRNRLLHESTLAELRTTEPFLKMVDDLKNN